MKLTVIRWRSECIGRPCPAIDTVLLPFDGDGQLAGVSLACQRGVIGVS